MSKHEAPPFRMVIERGKLVPATAYDAERLDTYRSGSTVRVRFVEERDRWGIRKWWAVVNRAVKECPTPWQTAAEASEAIKLALGIVNLTKTVGGEFMAYPKSLTELTDPELEDAVEQMLAVMTRVTGIDPDDWRKHIADIGKDEPSEPSDESARSTDAGTSDPSPVPVPVAGATLSADEADAPAQGAAGQVETGATAPETNAVETGHGGQPASVSTALTDADRAWLLSVAKQLWPSAAVGEQELVTAIAKDLEANVPAEISVLARKKEKSVVAKVKEVCFGEKTADVVKVDVAAMIWCEPREIAS